MSIVKPANTKPASHFFMDVFLKVTTKEETGMWAVTIRFSISMALGFLDDQ
jgi:hypothetical protein